LFDNRIDDPRKETGQMEQEPQPARNRAARDGLAALAIVLLAAVLIAVVINNFV
jgi:hypothetical protein